MSWRDMEYCPKHGAALQDFNEYGDQYRRPVCLECRWESGAGRLLTKVFRKLSAIKSKFMLHWGPETAYIRRNLTDRLNRVVKARYETLEEVAYAIAGPKHRQPPREESVPVQTNIVISALRKFEEQRGRTVRTKQTTEERKEQDRLDTTERLKVGQAFDSGQMLSLDDPNVAYAADFARYHELGGAKKRRTRDMDLNEGADNR